MSNTNRDDQRKSDQKMDQNKKDQSNQGSQKNLSDAANKMRTSSDPKERSEAAKTMGKAGGSQSHKNS